MRTHTSACSASYQYTSTCASTSTITSESNRNRTAILAREHTHSHNSTDYVIVAIHMCAWKYGSLNEQFNQFLNYYFVVFFSNGAVVVVVLLLLPFVNARFFHLQCFLDNYNKFHISLWFSSSRSLDVVQYCPFAKETFSCSNFQVSIPVGSSVPTKFGLFLPSNFFFVHFIRNFVKFSVFDSRWNEWP